MVKIAEFVKKYDTILYLLGLVIVGILLCGIVNAYAGQETIKDDNDGNKGYILINTGTLQGGNDVGHWTDIKDVLELKGEKGDIGDTGLQGIQGLTGDRGEQGLQGINGIDGLNGEQGIQGDIGDTGEQGYTPIKNVDYFDGLNGKDGKDVDPKEVKRLDSRIDDVSNRLSKLERTQFVLETSFRIVDTKRVTLRPFFRQNFTRNKIDVVGLKIDIKLGRSYEEKLIEKVNRRLDLLEKTIGNAPIIEKVIDTKGNIKSITISANGLNVRGKF